MDSLYILLQAVVTVFNIGMSFWNFFEDPGKQSLLINSLHLLSE